MSIATTHQQVSLTLAALACAQALLFGRAKRALRERASEGPRKGSDRERVTSEEMVTSALRAETSCRYQSDPPENQTWHADEGGASLACYQSTLFSGTSFFSQWYFPSSERSRNKILWEIVASSPFLCPSRLRRSLARSWEASFARPNTRAYSQTIAAPIVRFRIHCGRWIEAMKTRLCMVSLDPR